MCYSRYGFFSGSSEYTLSEPTFSRANLPVFFLAVVSLYFPTVCALDPDTGSTGVRLGIACLPVGIASLVGTPIAEALIGRENHWWYGLGFAGAAEMVSTALLAFAWAVEKRRMQSLS